MDKTLNINTGDVMLLNEESEVLSSYDSVNINAGNAVVSRNVYEKLIGMGVSIKCGNMNIIDIKGKLVELANNTVITEAMSFEGCYLLCNGNLIIEDAKGLNGITGLYASHLFRAESVSIESHADIDVKKQIIYPDGAKLHIGSMAIDETSHITLESDTLYWVHGKIKVLDGSAVEEIHRKGITFHCNRLIIYKGLYEENKTMFTADKYTFIPDGYAVVDEITLDAATALLYSERLFVLGDMMIPHDQVQHLKEFSSLIINGTVIMPLTAAAEFKAVGKACDYDLYEGVLLSINGFQMLGPEQCRTAIAQGITYTLKVNGALYFTSDVTAEDIEAIAAVHCNGMISAPDRARGALDTKVKEINGTILDIHAIIKKFYSDEFTLGDNPLAIIKKLMRQIKGGDDGDGSSINSGSFKL